MSNSIYDVTSNDVQRAEEERKTKAVESQLFIPRSEKEREKEKKMAKFRRCNVKYETVSYLFVFIPSELPFLTSTS